MIWLCLLEGSLVGAMAFALVLTLKTHATERQELTDRLMAIMEPVALSQVTGLREQEPSTVRYVGEEAYSPLLRDTHATDATT